MTLSSLTKSSTKPLEPPPLTLPLTFLPPQTRIIFFTASIISILNGLTYPALAWVFSDSFSKLSSLNMNSINELALTFFFIGLVAFILSLLQNTLLEHVSNQTHIYSNARFFRALISQDSSYYDTHSLQNYSEPSYTLSKSIGRTYGELLQFMATIICGFAYSFYESWKTSLFVMCCVPLMSVCMIWLMRLNTSEGERKNRCYEKASVVAGKTLMNVRTVGSLNCIREFLKEYEKATEWTYRASIRPLYHIGLANGLMLSSFIILYLLLTLVGSYLIYDQVSRSGCDPTSVFSHACHISGKSVLGSMLGIAFAGQGLSQVSKSLECWMEGRNAGGIIMEVMERCVGGKNCGERVVDLSNNKDEKGEEANDEENSGIMIAILPEYKIDVLGKGGSKPSLNGPIVFQNISFSYPTRPYTHIFDSLSLEITPNTSTAIVGPSGSGKSTLFSLLIRHYDVTSGHIYINDVNITDINVQHLRRNIGYVMQEPQLLEGSVEENIKGGLNVDQEELERVMRMSHCEELRNVSGGLSGGQKQRICIGRVLLRKGEILLLDEATSALDSQSELLLQDTFSSLTSSSSQTIVIIAHRLTTIRQCSEIIFMDKGNVMERGSHDELMQKNGFYKKLVEIQYKNLKNGHVTIENETDISETIEPMNDISENQDHQNDVIPYHESLEVPIHHPEFLQDNSQISFQNICFSYPTRPNTVVLKNFNLNIYPNETLALVGPSGCGKSTIASLLERFYNVQSGTIRINNTNIVSMKLHDLRDMLGYVPQEATLFQESIKKNVMYGKKGATMEDVEEACQMANIDGVIQGFEKGYETLCGDSGLQLSGGQKQRIAIARALIKHPKILILDEATSALDSHSESIVQATLDKLIASQKCTIIIIAHRLSTIINANRIAYINNGHVMEIGSHDELMRKNGCYKKLVDIQKYNHGVDVLSLKQSHDTHVDNQDTTNTTINYLAELEEDAKSHINSSKARKLALKDWKPIVMGSIGALLTGGVYPAWGVMFGLMIELLFHPVMKCSEETVSLLGPYETCSAYWRNESSYMKAMSEELSIYWSLVLVACIVGHVMVFVGYGMASERLNKRVRDGVFKGCVRQEIGFFDKIPVTTLLTQLQSDSAKIHAFSGQPIRIFLINVSSVLCGLLIAFIYAWPFALVAIAIIPLMGFATAMEGVILL